MSIVLDKEIYNWLLALEAVKISTQARELGNGKFELDPNITTYFSSGLIFSRLLHQIIKTLPKNTSNPPPSLRSLETMKFSQTSASKIYNWNLIMDILKKLDVPVDNDFKTLIVNGDLDMINELLKEIYNHYHPKGGPKDENKNQHTNVNHSLKPFDSEDGSTMISVGKSMSSKAQASVIKKIKSMEDTIDINAVDVNKDLSNTNTVLEFFLVSLGKHLSLTPKQALSLLANNFKFLAHILAKGVKGVFEPVTYWYQDIYANTAHLIQLIMKDKEHNVNLVQQACKAGFLSRSIEVCQWCCRFYSKLAYEFADHNMIHLAWEWFTSDSGGLTACVNGLKRHPDISESCISVLVQYARYNMIEMFTIHLKSVCPEPRDHLNIMKDLFKPLTESKFTKEEISTSGIIDAWLDTTLKYSENDPEISKDTRFQALSFLCDIWFIYPNRIEEQDHIAAGILNSLKRAVRDNSRTLQLSATALLFRLLEHFASEKDNYAAVVYKTLTFCLVENIQNIDIREFLLRNFKILFETNESIPVGILIEPLLKQLQMNPQNYIFNIFDFEFFGSIVRHSKFSTYNALQLFYIVADIYLNNMAFSKPAHRIMMEILNNHLHNESVQDAVSKFVKASLAMFFSSEKQKKPKEKPLPKYNNKSASLLKPVPAHETEKETLNAQKRSLVIEILKGIITMNNPVVNDKAKTYILYTHLQLKLKYEDEHKGLVMLVSMFGDPVELTNKFERDLKDQTKEPSPDGVTRSVDLGNKPAGERDSGLGVHKSQDLEALNFLRDIEITRKKKAKPKQKMTKAQMSEAALKRMPKPDPKALDDIETIKREFQQKKLKRFEEQESERDKFERERRALKQQLDKRKIELGVANVNSKDQAPQLIFDEGSREFEKIMEKKHGLPEIEIIALDQEEDRDRQVVNILMRKYFKVIKHLFNSYSNSGFSTENKDTFASFGKKLATINTAELWKLLQDYEVSKFVNRDEFKVLIKNVNTQLMERYEMTNLTFHGFEHFLIQFSIFAFGRPPKNLGHLPIFVSVEELFRIFRDVTHKKRKSTVLYDDPDATEMGDKELNKYMNQQLQSNPEYQLPDAYKKVEDKDYKVAYEMNPAVKVDSKYLMAYSVLDEILDKALKIRLLEPAVTFQTVLKAKLKIFNPQNVNNWSNDNHMKPIEKKVTEKPPRIEPEEIKKRRVLNIENKPIPNLTLKKEVAQFPYKDRARAGEVAEVMEEMLCAVVEGKTALPKREPHLGIINKAIEERRKLEQEEEAKRNQKNQKLAKRYNELKDKHGDLIDFRKKQREERLKKMKEEEEKEKLRQLNPNKEKVRKDHAEKIRKDAEEYKEKKKKEEEEKKKKEEEEKRKERDRKNKEFEEWNKNKIEKYETRFKSNKEKEQKQKEEEAKKQKEKEELAKKNREKALEVLKKDKEDTDHDKKVFADVKEAIHDHSHPFRKVFDKHEISMKLLFNHYYNSVHKPIDLPFPKDGLVFDAYCNFMAEFVIYPSIVNRIESLEIYNGLTSHKEIIDKVPVSLTYDEFLEALVRIAYKGHDKFAKIYERKKRVDEAEEDENKDAEKEDDDRGRKMSGQNEENKEEAHKTGRSQTKSPSPHKVTGPIPFAEIDVISTHTLEGLLDFLDLPDDKKKFVEKIKRQKAENKLKWREKKNYWRKDLVVDNLQQQMIDKFGMFKNVGPEDSVETKMEEGKE